MDENLQVLKILSDIAETTFRSKKSSLARIKASGFNEDGEQKLIKTIVQPLDDSLDYLSQQVLATLTMIPIYNFFLSKQNGISLFDSAQLISIIKNVDNFSSFSHLMSYAGFIPDAKNYNKKLHKLLQKLSYKLIKYNPQYQFIFDINVQKYSENYPKYTQEHINNMAKRIVVKKFLKNLYFSWNQINKEDF
jgi:hypothetical protein